MKINFHRYVSPKQDYAGFSRRMFLMTSTMAGVTTSAMLAGARPVLAAALDADQSAMLLRMVQDIYPHTDLLSIDVYQAIADGVSAGADADEANATALKAGLDEVDTQAQALFGASYVDIEDDDAREGILRTFQNEGFFQGIRWAAYFGIYNNPDVWPKFGYQGSSVEHGGYIDRGFSDITFVPEGPTLEERIAQVKG
ncbi:gluconate 2-dehydrogenase subunit 3 family protein [uncultured Roseobacter sp.]|uniref:gluconate 2-dehydrogenase subunit 3 family protein n=1 Tax=uncultured Roseobacter sp. TaxID=114847 RepID=UPI00261BC76E|nr:gluconate 2-dehydrogenase subunit 3 family protein [uncultured Roseobacter sp.]